MARLAKSRGVVGKLHLALFVSTIHGSFPSPGQPASGQSLWCAQASTARPVCIKHGAEPEAAGKTQLTTGDSMAKPGRKGPGKSGLSEKQKRFVEEYLVDLNATQAAKRAGYSEKTAYRTGADNLKKPQIAEAIAVAQAARSERVQIDADWVLARLAAEVDADLAELIGDDGDVRPVKDWPEIWRKGLVSGLDVQEINSEGTKIGQTVKLKLSDRLKRLELIGKHVNVQAFREQHGVSDPNGDPIQVITRKVIDPKADGDT